MRVQICNLFDEMIVTGEMRQQTDDFMVIQCDRISELEPSDTVIIFTLDEKEGVKKYRCAIKSMTHFQVTVWKMEFLGAIDRRSSFKVRTNIDTLISNCKSVESDVVETFMPPVKGKILNLSIGGMFLVAERQFDIGMIIDTPIKALDKKIECQAEILRHQPDRLGPNGHGCKFLSLRRNDEEQLFQLLYALQIRQKRQSPYK